MWRVRRRASRGDAAGPGRPASARVPGCATPATKKETLGLLARGIDFGILPGGMEEVALYEEGHDRIYIKKRAGFIKYRWPRRNAPSWEKVHFGDLHGLSTS